MIAERRELETFTKDLTPEQVATKKQLTLEAMKSHPEIPEYFVELCVDFCVRHPEEATNQRLRKEWENLPSNFSPESLQKISG